jgi:hypothetical protein
MNGISEVDAAMKRTSERFYAISREQTALAERKQFHDLRAKHRREQADWKKFQTAFGLTMKGGTTLAHAMAWCLSRKKGRVSHGSCALRQAR